MNTAELMSLHKPSWYNGTYTNDYHFIYRNQDIGSAKGFEKMADCLLTIIMYFVLYFTMFSLIVVTFMLNFE
jgi:hypothetical protein